MPTVSASEIGLNTFNEVNLIASTFAEIEQIDDIDFDNAALLLHNANEFIHFNDGQLCYLLSNFSPFFIKGFHSRAPPLRIFQPRLIT